MTKPKAKKLFIGIDPGLDGGITVLDEKGNIVFSQPMPTIKVGDKRKLDSNELGDLLSPDKGAFEIAVCIEKVGAMPKQGVTSVFTFGYGAGILEGIVAAFAMRYELVIPQRWMKEVLTGLPKEAGTKSSIAYCSRTWPEQNWKATERSKKAHDGMTDSACIAAYCRKIFG